MNGVTKATAGISSLIAVPISVLISFLTSSATVEVKAERNESDIHKVNRAVEKNREQAIRNEERLISLKESQEQLKLSQKELKDLLMRIDKNTR